MKPMYLQLASIEYQVQSNLNENTITIISENAFGEVAFKMLVTLLTEVPMHGHI